MELLNRRLENREVRDNYMKLQQNFLTPHLVCIIRCALAKNSRDEYLREVIYSVGFKGRILKYGEAVFALLAHSARLPQGIFNRRSYLLLCRIADLPFFKNADDA